LLIEVGVVGSLVFSVALGRDDDLGATISDPAGQVVGVVSLVVDGGIGIEAVDQVMGKGDVVALSGRADHVYGKAKGFGGGMDLGAQASARPAQTLGLRLPSTLRATAACW